MYKYFYNILEVYKIAKCQYVFMQESLFKLTGHSKEDSSEGEGRNKNEQQTRRFIFILCIIAACHK